MTTTVQPKSFRPEPGALKARKRSLIDLEIVLPAIRDSLRKLNPRHMVSNPVMFVTEVGAAITTIDLFFTSSSRLFAVHCRKIRSPWRSPGTP